MAIMKTSALALALAGAVSAQSQTVISVFLPGADPQTLEGSIIASDATATTLAFACPSDVDVNDCGFVDAVTATVGPSTFHAQETFDSLSLELDCQVTGTTAATCTQTYVGPAEFLGDDTPSATASDATVNTAVITTTTTTEFAAADITFLAVTITAAGDSNATTTDSGSESTATDGSQTTGSGNGGSQTSSSGGATESTESGNGATRENSRMFGWSIAGAGLMGLSMMLL